MKIILSTITMIIMLIICMIAIQIFKVGVEYVILYLIVLNISNHLVESVYKENEKNGD